MGAFEAGHGAPRQSSSSAAESESQSRLIVGLRVIGILLALSPILATLVKPIFPASIGDFIYALFSPVCHNRSIRTIEVSGVLMPLCSRCLGIFFGFGAAGLFPKPQLTIGQSLFYGFLASVLMVADVLMQDLGMHPVWHATRILTGVIWGHVCGLGVAAVARWLFERRSER